MIIKTLTRGACLATFALAALPLEASSTQDQVEVIVRLNDKPLFQSASYKAFQKEKAALGEQINKAVSAKKLGDYLQQVEQQQLSVMADIEKEGISFTLNQQFNRLVNGFAVQVSKDDIEKIKSLSNVISVTPSVEYKATLGRSVPRVSAPVAWQLNDAEGNPLKGEGMVVAVLDTGVDHTHPDLGGCLGDGCRVLKGWTYYGEDSMDRYGHGTHVAGIVGGNGKIVGVAPEVSFYAVKVLSDGGGGSDTSIISGMEWAADPDGDPLTDDAADVVNMSLGGPYTEDSPLDDAVDVLAESGVIVIASAGNNYNYNSVGSPGTAEKAIAVASTDPNDDISNFSSKGAFYEDVIKPDISAPGGNIFSSIPGESYASYNGTSMSAPHVAGAAALVKQLHPDWTRDQIESVLLHNVEQLDEDMFSQGNGFLDLKNLENKLLSVNENELYFGNLDSLDTVVSASKSFTLRNNGETTANLSLDFLKPISNGLIINSDLPDSLAAGEEIEVTVDLTIDTAVFNDFDSYSLAYFNHLTITSGEQELSLPFAVSRYAEVTLELTDFYFYDLIVFNDNGYVNHDIYASDGEVIRAPVGTYHIAGHDGGPSNNLVILENLDSTISQTVTIDQSTFTKSITFDSIQLSADEQLSLVDFNIQHSEHVLVDTQTNEVIYRIGREYQHNPFVFLEFTDSTRYKWELQYTYSADNYLEHEVDSMQILHLHYRLDSEGSIQFGENDVKRLPINFDATGFDREITSIISFNGEPEFALMPESKLHSFDTVWISNATASAPYLAEYGFGAIRLMNIWGEVVDYDVYASTGNMSFDRGENLIKWQKDESASDTYYPAFSQQLDANGLDLKGSYLAAEAEYIFQGAITIDYQEIDDSEYFIKDRFQNIYFNRREFDNSYRSFCDDELVWLSTFAQSTFFVTDACSTAQLEIDYWNMLNDYRVKNTTRFEMNALGKAPYIDNVQLVNQQAISNYVDGTDNSFAFEVLLADGTTLNALTVDLLIDNTFHSQILSSSTAGTHSLTIPFIDGASRGSLVITAENDLGNKSIMTLRHYFDMGSDAAPSGDADGDGMVNSEDTDDDNDGVLDSIDDFPYDDTRTTDTDYDGLDNSVDTDDDNDGVADEDDDLPLDGGDSSDFDGDGIGDNRDTDDDNDGVADVNDDFPYDASEWTDTDGDGIGNNADTDDDNDGVLDEDDDLPLDPSDSVDTDGDGIGNNTDPDDDNDGVADSDDAFPLDSSEWADNDQDGIGNNADTDDDNDGVADSEDAFPFDASEQLDTDGDGIGNNADTDDDNDGVADSEDLFPLDATESTDNDLDGIGDNADTDDDNDGMSDEWEINNGLDPLNASDATSDNDSDGLTNLDEFENGTDPANWDTDGDLMPDGFEVDNGLDPNFDLDANSDADADGYSNLEEYQAMSDVNNANSIPVEEEPEQGGSSSGSGGGSLGVGLLLAMLLLRRRK